MAAECRNPPLWALLLRQYQYRLRAGNKLYKEDDMEQGLNQNINNTFNNGLNQNHGSNKQHDASTYSSKIKAILTVVVFAAIIGTLFIMGRVVTPPAVLRSERRMAARQPAFTAETVLSAQFMDRFENYAADSFPFRESFRVLRSSFVFGAFMQTDKDGLYWDEYGIGEFAEVGQGSFSRAAEAINTAAGAMEGAGVNQYYAFIPDKSIYSSKQLPGFDPVLAEGLLAEVLLAEKMPESGHVPGEQPQGGVITSNSGVNGITFINLADALDAGSFYKTDLHWDQTKLGGVVEALGAAMGFNISLSRYAKEHATEFQGVYTGRLAMPAAPFQSDSLAYLNHPGLAALYLDQATQGMKPGPVYDHSRLAGMDAYDFFLSGAQPLIILEGIADSLGANLGTSPGTGSGTDPSHSPSSNLSPSSNSSPSSNPSPSLDPGSNPDGRELYLFRDSFSSALAPLLASAYSRIYLIDLRYIDMRTLNRLIDFKPGSDALFLYSTVILNNPDMLLVH
jgi:hypothetical protein